MSPAFVRASVHVRMEANASLRVREVGDRRGGVLASVGSKGKKRNSGLPRKCRFLFCGVVLYSLFVCHALALKTPFRLCVKLLLTCSDQKMAPPLMERSRSILMETLTFAGFQHCTRSSHVAISLATTQDKDGPESQDNQSRHHNVWMEEREGRLSTELGRSNSRIFSIHSFYSPYFRAE